MLAFWMIFLVSFFAQQAMCMESIDISLGVNKLRERFSEQKIQDAYEKAKVQKDEMLRNFWEKQNGLTTQEIKILAFCSEWELRAIERGMIIRQLSPNLRIAFHLSE